MKKIPTLFARNPRALWVTPEVTPGCEWALKGEGTATRMYDGACVMWDGRTWWERWKLKTGQPAPADFRRVEYDPVTGERIGWVPAHRSGRWQYLLEATTTETGPLTYPPGTYELVGPEIKRNPEGLTGHQVIRHAPKAPADSWPILYADAVLRGPLRLRHAARLAVRELLERYRLASPGRADDQNQAP